MTQKEALMQALNDLGGRAHLKDIYPIAIKYCSHKEGSKIKDALRSCIHRDRSKFRPSPGKPDGWWELVSYQEEVATLKQEIANLKNQISLNEKEIDELKKIPTEDAFVQKLIDATKTQFRFKRNDADSVRIVMDKVGRSDAEAIIGAWIEGREQKAAISVAGDIVIKKETNIDKNYGPNIENNGGSLSLPNQEMVQ